jgi:hypothetical protein
MFYGFMSLCKRGCCVGSVETALTAARSSGPHFLVGSDRPQGSQKAPLGQTH